MTTRQRAHSFLVGLGISIASVAVLAAVNFHNVSCSSDPADFSVSCAGTITGLGNGVYTLSVSATGTAETACRNRGGTEAPGQNPAAVTSAGTQTITVDSDSNGNYPFTVEGGAPMTPTAAQAGCPNNNWTVRIVSVDYTTATVTVKLGNTVVARKSFPIS